MDRIILKLLLLLYYDMVINNDVALFIHTF